MRTDLRTKRWCFEEHPDCRDGADVAAAPQLQWRCSQEPQQKGRRWASLDNNVDVPLPAQEKGNQLSGRQWDLVDGWRWE